MIQALLSVISDLVVKGNTVQLLKAYRTEENVQYFQDSDRKPKKNYVVSTNVLIKSDVTDGSAYLPKPDLVYEQLTIEGSSFTLKSCIALLWSSLQKEVYSGLSGSRYVTMNTDQRLGGKNSQISEESEKEHNVI